LSAVIHWECCTIASSKMRHFLLGTSLGAPESPVSFHFGVVRQVLFPKMLRNRCIVWLYCFLFPDVFCNLFELSGSIVLRSVFWFTKILLRNFWMEAYFARTNLDSPHWNNSSAFSQVLPVPRKQWLVLQLNRAHTLNDFLAVWFSVVILLSWLLHSLILWCRLWERFSQIPRMIFSPSVVCPTSIIATLSLFEFYLSLIA
jgi:hypothetical protein